ncbi:hypothetical protein BKA56DRAFT_686993 [Ilyonectria sp. MPI-CAGE-AT-0026]|nr:hypothetical protein BKA56DRAFT_686993 [Ilyonectria sp. MPI-CAGE-AT-0026]
MSESGDVLEGFDVRLALAWWPKQVPAGKCDEKLGNTLLGRDAGRNVHIWLDVTLACRSLLMDMQREAIDTTLRKFPRFWQQRSTLGDYAACPSSSRVVSDLRPGTMTERLQRGRHTVAYGGTTFQWALSKGLDPSRRTLRTHHLHCAHSGYRAPTMVWKGMLGAAGHCLYCLGTVTPHPCNAAVAAGLVSTLAPIARWWALGWFFDGLGVDRLRSVSSRHVECRNSGRHARP